MGKKKKRNNEMLLEIKKIWILSHLHQEDFIASASRDIWLNQQKSVEQMIIVSYSIES